jgi:ribosomal protein S18 acetylase RimI-like enzyme
MKHSDSEIIARLHMRSDTERIVTMINRDPFHLLNGVSVEEFEQALDEPGRRIRDNTFVVETDRTVVGFFSLSFFERDMYLAVDCFGTVDLHWRRRGIGTKTFEFIFDRLGKIREKESKQIQFKHRALSCIPGEERLGVNFGMKEQSILEILCFKNMDDLTIISQPPELFGFRPPTIEEADIWARIYNEAFNDNRSTESFLHEFKGANFSKNLNVFCTDQCGNPIGILSTTVNDSHARIPTIAVSRKWQKQGVGKILLSEGLQRLKELGVSDVRLTVDSTNEAARSLYKKSGFNHESKRINFVTTF